MKCFFLRATSRNETKTGVIEYNEKNVNELIYECLSRINKRGISFTVTHDRAGVVPHVHAILIIDDNHITRFELFKYFPYINVEEIRNLEATYRYLIHKGYKKKDYYPQSAVFGLVYNFVGGKLFPKEIPYHSSKSKEFEKAVLGGDRNGYTGENNR